MKAILITIVLLVSTSIYSQNLPKGIYKDSDKFKTSTTYYTEPTRAIHYTKVIDEDGISYYMGLNINSASYQEGIGAKILLENGTVISKSTDTHSRLVANPYGGATWIHSTFFKLTEQDIVALKLFKVTDIKVYLYDGQLSKKVSKKAQSDFNNIIAL